MIPWVTYMSDRMMAYTYLYKRRGLLELDPLTRNYIYSLSSRSVLSHSVQWRSQPQAHHPISLSVRESGRHLNLTIISECSNGCITRNQVIHYVYIFIHNHRNKKPLSAITFANISKNPKGRLPPTFLRESSPIFECI